MESIHHIRSRLGSVKNIGTITKAMEVVSATKMRRAQSVALGSRDYAFAALRALTELLAHTPSDELEQHPIVNAYAGTFSLNTAAGNERKTTGSYYTPDQLVQLLIVSALLPVIADRLSKANTREEKEAAREALPEEESALA